MHSVVSMDRELIMNMTMVDDDGNGDVITMNSYGGVGDDRLLNNCNCS